jgi:Domain of unknown function (DUF4294)
MNIQSIRWAWGKIVVVGVALLWLPQAKAWAGPGPYDTILVSAVEEKGVLIPWILLPEYSRTEKGLDAEQIRKIARMRSDVFTVYPYATAAASMLREIQTNLDRKTTHRERKEYLKSIDHQLDAVFKEPLKNLTIDQGHILVKLVDRQTGRNCFSIIREYKNGFSAVMWQSVGLFFNNNLVRRYDPEDDDKDLERIVLDLEASNLYRYELYQQDMLLSKLQKRR